MDRFVKRYMVPKTETLDRPLDKNFPFINQVCRTPHACACKFQSIVSSVFLYVINISLVASF